MPGFPDRFRDPRHRLHPGLLGLRRLPEKGQGGERLPVDLPRGEDRHHLRRQPLQLRRASLAGVEQGQVQGDQGRLVRDAFRQEALAGSQEQDSACPVWPSPWAILPLSHLRRFSVRASGKIS